MWNGFTTDDLCIDYKLKFGVKTYKLHNKELSLGLFFNKHCFSTYLGDRYEYYLHLNLFKWCVSIGWFLEEVKNEK